MTRDRKSWFSTEYNFRLPMHCHTNLLTPTHSYCTVMISQSILCFWMLQWLYEEGWTTRTCLLICAVAAVPYKYRYCACALHTCTVPHRIKYIFCPRISKLSVSEMSLHFSVDWVYLRWHNGLRMNVPIYLANWIQIAVSWPKWKRNAPWNGFSGCLARYNQSG